MCDTAQKQAPGAGKAARADHQQIGFRLSHLTCDGSGANALDDARVVSEPVEIEVLNEPRDLPPGGLEFAFGFLLDPLGRDAGISHHLPRDRRVGVDEGHLRPLQERLADQVRWVSEIEGDGAGYDILSFSPRGEQRMLEVKTTCGTERTPFYLTRNELRLSDERPEEFRLVLVHQFVNDPKLFVLAPPLTRHVMLEPTVYRAGWG